MDGLTGWLPGSRASKGSKGSEGDDAPASPKSSWFVFDRIWIRVINFAPKKVQSLNENNQTASKTEQSVQ